MPGATPAVRSTPFTYAKPTLVKPGPALLGIRPKVTRPIPPPPAAPPVLDLAPLARLPGHRRLLGWMSAHRVLVAGIAFLIVTASVVTALVVSSQPIVATPTAGTAPVVFGQGDDIASLDLLNLADVPVITTGGGSATITIYGIPGATALSLGEILELTNTNDAGDAAFTVTLSVSGTPAASLTGFTMTFLDDVSGVPTLRTWNLLTTPTLTTYTISDAEVWEFTVSSLVMTAAATGSQGALTITATITQV